MKKLIAAALAATTAVVPIEAQASTLEDHARLAAAIESTGITLKINPKECGTKEGKVYGWYWAAYSEMVVCQENGTPGGPVVKWTEEDLDTLRHEAQHLIQDCMDGKMDGRLQSVYKYPIVLGLDIIGPEGVASVSRSYHNTSSNTIIMEIEAFAVAAMDNPLEQVQDIQNYCL